MFSLVVAARLGYQAWQVFLPPAGSSISAIVSLGLGVFLIVTVLSVSQGLESTFSQATDREVPRFMIGRAGARGESGSSLLFEEVHVGTEIEAIDIRSEEMIVWAHDLPLQRERAEAPLPIRGVTSAAFELRPEVRIRQGRNFRSGKAEAIVGIGAARTFSGLEIGDTLSHYDAIVGPVDWTVVGHFSAEGNILESEVWVDLTTSQSLYRGGSNMLSVVWFTINREASVNTLRTALDADPRYPVTVKSEQDILSERQGLPAQRIQDLVYVTSALLLCASMLITVAVTFLIVGYSRQRIVTLYSLGFARGVIAQCLAISVIALALIGGLLGSAASYAFIDEYASSTSDGYRLQASFQFEVTHGGVFISNLSLLIAVYASALLSAYVAVNPSRILRWQEKR